MFTSSQYSRLLFAFPVVLVYLLLQKRVATAEIASESQEFYNDEFVAAISEGVLVVGLYSAVVFVDGFRRKFKGKSTQRFDKLCYEGLAAQQVEPSMEMPVKRTSRKDVCKVFAQASQIAEERERLTERVHSLSKSGDIPGAAKAMAKLEDTCGTPGLRVYTSLIRMCSRARSAQGAEMWMKRLQAKQLEMEACAGKRFEGTVKEFIPMKFGYIACDETHAVFKQDIFLRAIENPEQVAKGEKVSFVLQFDRRSGMPQARGVSEIRPV